MKQKLNIFLDDCDYAGIVFFGNYFRLAHRTLELCLPKIDISWESWFNNKDWVVPLRHAEASYEQPLFVGKIYDVELTTKKLGDSSVTFQTQIFNEQKLCSTVTTTHVFVHPQTKKKISIPKEFREKLTNF